MDLFTGMAQVWYYIHCLLPPDKSNSYSLNVKDYGFLNVTVS